MLAIQKKCRVCQVVKTNKVLLQRIYECSWFIPHSRDTPKDIVNDYHPIITYESLLNHVKKHQFIDSQDYQEKMLAFADQKAQIGAVRQAVKAVDAVQSVIDIGKQRLEDGKISVDTNQLIRASQIKLTHESKQKDQELATIEMVAHFLSMPPEKQERLHADIEINPAPITSDLT